VTTIRTIHPTEWQAYKAIRLRALADAPDAFGSTLSLEAQRPDALWQERLTLAAASNQDLPLFAMAGNEPIGLAWAKVDADDPGTVHLFQMWVAPEHRGRGVGRGLLEHAVRWARSRNATYLSLGVTCGDTPAFRLYASAGFVAVGAPEPLREGSPLRAVTMRLSLARC
jgi:ribosomal protein S18 acetylase RimI-like enzyme